MTRSIVEIHVPIESIILLDVRALVQMLFLFVFLLILLEETIEKQQSTKLGKEITESSKCKNICQNGILAVNISFFYNNYYTCFFYISSINIINVEVYHHHS